MKINPPIQSEDLDMNRLTGCTFVRKKHDTFHMDSHFLISLRLHLKYIDLYVVLPYHNAARTVLPAITAIWVASTSYSASARPSGFS